MSAVTRSRRKPGVYLRCRLYCRTASFAGKSRTSASNVKTVRQLRRTPIATFVPAMREVSTNGTPHERGRLFQRSAPGVEMRFLKRRGPTFRSSTSGLTQKVRRKRIRQMGQTVLAAYRQGGSPGLLPESDRPIGTISAPKHGGDSEQEAWVEASATGRQRMAQRIYEREVPRIIRNLGEPAVRAYLKGRHFSHRISVRNAPASAKAPSNVVLEIGSANLARGSRNMSSAGVAAAKKGQRISAIKVAGNSVVRGSVKAGAFAAATEAAVSIPENLLHFKRGRKTGGQAVKDTTKSAAGAAAIGVAIAGAAKVAAMAGVGLSLGTLGTPVMIAGGLVFAGTAIRRVHKAAKHDLPLDELTRVHLQGWVLHKCLCSGSHC